VDGRSAISLILGVALGYTVARRVLCDRGTASRAALTDRQREILRAVALGRTTKEIALELGITPASVNTHIRRAMSELGVPTRAAAAVRVADQALTVPASPRLSAA
jgi:DNA-binding CsgD family transcriptional regulator